MSDEETKEESGKAQGDPPNLNTHPLVEKHHPNPNEIRDVVSLAGYIGPSNTAGNVRLYSDLTFQHYYEIPRSGIVSTSSLNADDENSPTTVDLKPDTKLQQVSISSQSVEASFLKGAISGGFLGAASAAAPSGGTPCFIVMTTVQCTFGGAAAGQAQAATPNFTCVPIAQTLATTCTQVHCNHAGMTKATVCTQVVTHGAGAAAAPQANTIACATFVTAVPSNCQPDFTCIPVGNTVATTCTQIHCNHAGTTAATVCTQRVTGGVGAAAPQAQAAFCATFFTAVPSGCHQPICLTVVTANPTDCGPICPTVFTAVPSTCHPSQMCTQGAQPAAGGQGVVCATFVTANPTDCGRPVCATFVTANPTDCGPICPTVFTAVPSTCRPTHFCTQTTQPGPVAGGAAAACITIATANPTWCHPQTPPCITLHTHYPTFCPPCHPVVTTAATVCTQTGVPPRTVDCPGAGTQGQIVCPTVFTAVPSGCHQPAPCPTVWTAVPTWCG
ncbi:MAG: hypothetical protein ACREDR_03390 [Blastocatellia bacterium]